MKTTLFFAFIALLMTSSSTMAQDYSGDFSWAGTNVTSSSTTVTACGVRNIISLTSSPAPHSNSSNSAVFPNTTSNASSPITITLRFSQPVCNLRLKIDDLDFVGSETMRISPAVVSVTPSINPAGPVFTNVGGIMTPPNNVNNTIGWVQFSSTPISAVNITYSRRTGYWAFLDSLTYDCCTSCGCDNKKNTIDATAFLGNSGSTSADLTINSAGVPIRKLNISVPFYQSLAGRGCIKCDTDPINVSRYGKILNLPMIAGVTPTFTGTSSGTVGSAEIVYEFPTPVVLNHAVTLKLQFPPTNSNCKNPVRYCVKLGLIDAKCTICEQLLCVAPRPIIINPKANTSGVRKATMDGAASVSPKMFVNPNPVSTTVTVTVPNVTEGTLEILDLTGKSLYIENVNSDKVELNVEHLNAGTYFLKYVAGDQVLTEQFMKQE